jgi:hypothetical protein
VVIAIDTSASGTGEIKAGTSPDTPNSRTPALFAPANPLAAQVRAARRFVELIEDRLGEVRVGIVSFPGTAPRNKGRNTGIDHAASPADSEMPFARRELQLTDDAAAIQRVLKRLLDRGRAGPMSFTDGLALAVDELFRPQGRPGAARVGARRMVVLAADGSGGFPFGPSAQADLDFSYRNIERARSASQSGVALHLFALGGLAEDTPAFVKEMLTNSASSFTRVQKPSRANFISDRVSMPYLEALSIHDAATGKPIQDLSYTTDGHFSAWADLVPGRNRLVVRAQTSDGDAQESQFVLNFDGRAYRDRLLAEEAARARRTRNQLKHLQIEVEK